LAAARIRVNARRGAACASIVRQGFPARAACGGANVAGSTLAAGPDPPLEGVFAAGECYAGELLEPQLAASGTTKAMQIRRNQKRRRRPSQ